MNVQTRAKSRKKRRAREGGQRKTGGQGEGRKAGGREAEGAN